MKLCPHCQEPNAPDNRFCQQCGRPFPAPGAAFPDATVLFTATQVGTRAARQQTFSVSALFGTKTRVILGRAPDCDVCLPHPSVSRYHALVERRGDGTLRLRDLSSVNGLSVGGRRIGEPTVVREGDR